MHPPSWTEVAVVLLQVGVRAQVHSCHLLLRSWGEGRLRNRVVEVERRWLGGQGVEEQTCKANLWVRWRRVLLSFLRRTKHGLEAVSASSCDSLDILHRYLSSENHE
jgi:hypothetical protein